MPEETKIDTADRRRRLRGDEHLQPLADRPLPAGLVVEISADVAYEHGRWRHRPRFLRPRPGRRGWRGCLDRLAAFLP